MVNYKENDNVDFINHTSDRVVADSSKEFKADNEVLYRYETKKNESSLKNY